MRLFKTRMFAKWAVKQDLSDLALKATIDEIDSGLADVSYGGNLYKKRIARPEQGKSGGYRVLLAYSNQRACFLYGFRKNERSNISKKEKLAYKKLSRAILSLNNEEITNRLGNGSLQEIES